MDQLIYIYSATYRTKVQFKFRNHFDCYSIKLRLHLAKLTDPDEDVRSVIRKFTNNNEEQETKANSAIEKVEDMLKNAKEEYRKLINLKNIRKREDELKDNSEMVKNLESLYVILQDLKKQAKEPVKLYGKLPEDKQYTDPKTQDHSNRLTVNFETALRTKLTDSTIFKEHVQICHTWNKSLPPSSIQEFNLTHHLGDGIHLNTLYDYSQRNLDHPSGYFFILEQLGDRRGEVTRIKTQDSFTGYSPGKVLVEFEHAIEYLSETLKDGRDRLVTHRFKKREEDFDEKDSTFEEEFCPDRAESFNLDIENILTNKDKRQKPEAEYKLEYDSSIFGGSNTSSPTLEQLKKLFSDFGYDPNTVTENDKVFTKNFKKRDISEQEDTPDAPPPNDNIINLDD